MDALYKVMFEHLEDEIDDACEYLRKAHEAEEEGRSYLAKGLNEMAMDEYSHANFLREYLMKKEAYHNHEHYAAVEEHWHRLKAKLGLK